MADIPALFSALIALGALGVIFGISLALSARFFHVEEDPRVEKVYEELPHIDCGACGYPGCHGYAEAVVKGEAGPDLCVPGGAETTHAVACVMGLEVDASQVKKIAMLKCGGRDVADKFDAVLSGIQDCRAAALLHGGPKECSYGCIGLATCAEVCPVDAIVMEGNFPRVIDEKCIACGNCVRACPKNLYELRPETNEVYVACSSQDKGAVVRKICKAGCIGCKKCEKVCPVSAPKVTNFLSYIDPEVCDNLRLCVPECPTNCIIDRKAGKVPAEAGASAEA